MPTTMEKPAKKKAAQQATESTKPALAVEVPFVLSAKYAQRVIHMELKGAEAETLRSVLEGLEESRATLENGRPVASSQDALRWILQRVRARFAQ